MNFKSYLESFNKNEVADVVYNTLKNLGDLTQLAICGDLMEEKGHNQVRHLIDLYLEIFKQKDYCNYVLNNVGRYDETDHYKSIFNQIMAWGRQQGYRLRQAGSGGGFTGFVNERAFHPRYELHADKDSGEYSIKGEMNGIFGNPKIISSVTTFGHDSEHYKTTQRTGYIYGSSTKNDDYTSIPEPIWIVALGLAIQKLLCEYTLHCAASQGR